MSGTAAALRRNNAKSSVPPPQVPGRGGSVPSIRGANTFHQQQLLQQQMVVQQPNQMQHRQVQRNPQQQYQSQQPPPSQKPMTIDRAITLITLRLSRVEVAVQEFEQGEDNERRPFMNDDLAQNILTRLDALEENESNKPPLTLNDAVGSSEIVLLKQQMDVLKQFVTKSLKTTNAATSSLKTEIMDLRKSLQILERMCVDNNTQLMVLNMCCATDAMGDESAKNIEDIDEDEDKKDEEHTIDETFASSSLVFVEDEPDEQNEEEEE